MQPKHLVDIGSAWRSVCADVGCESKERIKSVQTLPFCSSVEDARLFTGEEIDALPWCNFITADRRMASYRRCHLHGIKDKKRNVPKQTEQGDDEHSQKQLTGHVLQTMMVPYRVVLRMGSPTGRQAKQ